MTSPRRRPPADTEGAAEEALRGSRAESHNDDRVDGLELRVEPGGACGDLAPARLVVDAPLAARSPLEVLDGVRHVETRAIDPSLGERLVENPAGGADE